MLELGGSGLLTTPRVCLIRTPLGWASVSGPLFWGTKFSQQKSRSGSSEVKGFLEM